MNYVQKHKAKFAVTMLLLSFLLVGAVNQESAYAAGPRCFNSDNEEVECPPVDRYEDDTCYAVTEFSDTEIECEAAADGDLQPVETDASNTGDSGTDEVFNDDALVDTNENPIITRLVEVINFLAFGVGMVVIGSIIVSGIQYMVSQGNSQKTAAARDRIIMSLIGLALFMLMFAILQWLIPGGVFNQLP